MRAMILPPADLPARRLFCGKLRNHINKESHDRQMKTENIFFGQMAVAAAAALCSLGVVGADKIVNASSFGWNAEDSTSALQAAFDSGAGKVFIDRQAGDWISRPLFITNSNIEVVLADGVTLKAKRGEFYRRTDCLIRITGMVKNVVLRGEGNATVKMNKADYHDPKQKYAHSEWRHAVSILSAQDVTVKDLAILSSGGDGIYVNGAKNVTLENLVVRDHHRQGMSPISVDGMTVRRCCFNETSGTAPNSGIDMEPNRKSMKKYVNVLYEDCEFNGNKAHGIDFYFAALTASTTPVSITFRRCKAKGNGSCGVAFMAGNPIRIEKFGQVKGFVRFENCEFAGNHSVPVKITNLSTNGVDISFTGCVIDARGSKSECAILFNNSRFNGDFGNLAFNRCTVMVDEGKKVCAFEAPRGYGISEELSGEFAVECGDRRETFDLGVFAAKHRPRPELIAKFKSTTVEYPNLKPMSGKPPAKGMFTPTVRNPFVYVVSVPGAGEYKVHFRSKKLRKNRTEPVAAVVQMLDKIGTDLGMLDVPVGRFEYTIKAKGANVYRFEVSPRNTAVIQMACDGAVGALQADAPVALFQAENKSLYFCVPAESEMVSVNISPIEPVQAKLFDAFGREVADMPYQSSLMNFNVKRSKTASDEVWHLRFIRNQDDLRFQIGVGGIPLVSTDPNAVITAR